MHKDKFVTNYFIKGFPLFYTILYNLIEGVITNIDISTLVYVQTKLTPLKMAI